MPVSRLRDESGANAVEFALILPILIVILFGILYGGLVINNQLSVTQAAREAARYGATAPVIGDSPSPSWFADIRTRGMRASAGTLSDEDSVCIWFVHEDDSVIADPSNSCTGGPPVIGLEDDGDRVVVAVARPAVLELVLYRFDTTLHGQAVARHEGGLNVEED